MAAPTTSPSVKWTYPTNDSIWSSPVVSDGVVYIGSDDHYLYAINAQTGELRWRYETGSEIFGTPAVAAGTIYVGSTDKNVYAIDAKTGKEKWTFETDGIVISSPIVVDGTVYIGGNCLNLECEWNYSVPEEGHGVVHAIDANTGARLWQYQTDDGVSSSPAIDDGTVYIGSSDWTVHAIDSTTGTQVWRYEAGTVIQSTPAISKGAVYVGDWNGTIHGIDATSGERKWLVKTNGSYITGSASVCGNTVFIGVVGVPSTTTSGAEDEQTQRYRGKLFALNSDSGTERWSFKVAPPEIGSSPAVTESLVIVGSHDQEENQPGGLYAVNRDTGHRQWRFDVSGVGIGSSPAVVEGTVYFGSTEGDVYALEGA